MNSRLVATIWCRLVDYQKTWSRAALLEIVMSICILYNWIWKYYNEMLWSISIQCCCSDCLMNWSGRFLLEMFPNKTGSILMYGSFVQTCLNPLQSIHIYRSFLVPNIFKIGGSISSFITPRGRLLKSKTDTVGFISARMDRKISSNMVDPNAHARQRYFGGTSRLRIGDSITMKCQQPL